MPSRTSSKSKSSGSNLIGLLEPYFTKQAPFQIPEAGRKMLVAWLPWISLILGVLCVLAFLPLIGLGAVVTSLSASVGYSAGMLIWIPLLLLLGQGIIHLVAFPGLRRRSFGAWKLLFWADIIYFVYNVVNAFVYPATLITSLLGAVLSVLIGLYILYQVKKFYK